MTGESKFSRETCSTCQIQSRARSTPLQWPHFVRCAIELFTVKQRVTSGQLLSQQEVVQEVGEPRHFGVIEPIRVRGWWPA